MPKNKRRATLSWLAVAALVILCGVLGVLQYRWIGEVRVAERERLRDSLQASLNRLSNDFNSEITAACRALLPPEPHTDLASAEKEIAARYEQWKKTDRHASMFEAVATALAGHGSIELHMLDGGAGVFNTAQWPQGWKVIRERLESRMSPESRQNRRLPGPLQDDEHVVLDLRVFRESRPEGPPPPFPMIPPGPPFGMGRREPAWLVLALNMREIREVLLPEVVKRHLGTADYEVEVLAKASPQVVYQSDPGQGGRIAGHADASVSLFELQYDQLFRWRAGSGFPDREPGGPAVRRGAGREFGRWQMNVRHRAGSLDTVVARTRARNLAVTGGVLLLMIASVGALLRFTRRAQRLAELQLDFVAGVSHELRTPLTVIHTAAYNLRGRMASNPGQVQRYGELIQEESGRLKEMVEQVLRFAGVNAGRVIHKPEPLCIEAVIEEAMETSNALLDGHAVERAIEPNLPAVNGDPVALRHALQNLLSNAAKYGTDEDKWIGVFASRAGDEERPAVEIRIADHGPGIPKDEQANIFDPFYRGRRALQDQIHGTGLGLTLVKKIIEAHGGSVRVNSEPAKGTEFIVRLPGVPA